MKVLFVRPPRYFWPFNSESSSFWQPLGFASMAAMLRENGIDVEIIDCLPLRMGWKSLKKNIEKKDFDILGIGDETASAIESIKLAQFVKEIKPKTKVVAGGYFFPYMKEHAKEWKIDYMINGEGEQTMLELCAFLGDIKKTKNYEMNGKPKQISSLRDIDGLIYFEGENIISNPERKPLNLDLIPLPAYDMLPMELYGKDSTNHKDYSAIEHGRGCSGNCDFCSINAHYGVNGNSCYRTKSAKRSFEETEILVKKYGRKTLNWCDGTFNLDPKWSREYFDLLEQNNIKVNHTAWMRADCIVRDEKTGLMKKMADNGLVQAVVGIERLSDEDNKKLGTCGKDQQTSEEALKILKSYKKIFVIATLIYGLPDDDKNKLKEISRFMNKDIADFRFLLPFTPYPTTRLWDEYKDKFTVDDFKSWNLHRPVMGTNHMTREQLDNWFKICMIKYPLKPFCYTRAFLNKDVRKRKVYSSLTKKVIKGLYRGVVDKAKSRKDMEYGRKPEWYDS